MKTKVLYLNHASVLIEKDGEYLLCDPWYHRPAFGSWLSAPPMFVHPAYLLGLQSKLRLLISHGHDDHCDDDFLLLFDRTTPIFSSDFATPSVRRRMMKQGFTNTSDVGKEPVHSGPFKIMSFRDDDVSEDDASYLILTEDMAIVHCNDNWFQLNPSLIDYVKAALQGYSAEQILFMSQTNSASGFPLNYTCFEDAEKRAILERKVHKMISVGVQNASIIGARFFHSYAGYAGVYVKDHPEYNQQSIFPTARYIRGLELELPPDVAILDFAPGDVFSNGEVTKSLFHESFFSGASRRASEHFYTQYGNVRSCSSYRDLPEAISQEWLKERLTFLAESLKDFVNRKVESNDLNPEILDQSLGFRITDSDLAMGVHFTRGIEPFDPGATKTMTAPGATFYGVLAGKDIFEALYTGYLAEMSRNPKDVYHRELVQVIVSFGYFFKNVLIPKQYGTTTAYTTN